MFRGIAFVSSLIMVAACGQSPDLPEFSDIPPNAELPKIVPLAPLLSQAQRATTVTEKTGADLAAQAAALQKRANTIAPRSGTNLSKRAADLRTRAERLRRVSPGTADPGTTDAGQTGPGQTER